MINIRTFGAPTAQWGTRTISGEAAQPRRLAVLALVARAGGRGISRDRLLALLWPDSAEDSARRSLSQALYALRQGLGCDELFLGVQDLRLNPDAAVCDVVEFEAALARQDHERAVELYHGPFLEGFRVPGATDLDRWIEEERSRLEHRYADALERLARRSAEQGDALAASGWWRRLAGLDPLNGRVAAELMEALAAGGERHAALRHAQIYEVLVEQDLGIEPDRLVCELAERLRREVPTAEAARPLAGPAVGDVAQRPFAEPSVGDIAQPNADHTTDEPGVVGITRGTAARRPLRRRKWALALIVLLFATTAALTFALRWQRPAASNGIGSDAPRGRPVIAVGHIADYTAEDGSGSALSDMLATNLARTDGLRVISTSRLYAVLPAEAPSEFGEAARAAGAGALIDGSLYRLGDGTLRLDLRRLDLRSGVVLSAFTLEAADLFALADAATAHLAGDLGLRAPVGSLASVSTHSAVAYRLYETGLRTFFNGGYTEASSLFRAALEEDSTFAMAAFYLMMSRSEHDPGLYQRLVRLASRVGDRERLTIRAHVAATENDPRLQVFADSLLALYPEEVEGYLYTGMVRAQSGNYPGAVRALRRAIEMDSISLKSGRLPCNACAAMIQLIGAYQRSDSLAAAERESRAWIRMQPNAAEAWRHLALSLRHADRGEEAQAAFARVVALNPDRTEGWAYVADHAMRRGEFARADSVLLDIISSGGPDDVEHARELLVFSLRSQGRLHAALHVANQIRAASAAAAGPQASELAQVLFERGRYREAAALFDSIGRWTGGLQSPTHVAYHRVWYLSRSATARAYAGDTPASMMALADSLRDVGARSAGVRSRVLHHYVRGLALAASGRERDAIEELRRSIYSPNLGFTRANVEIARLLQRQERHAEAIPFLQSVMRGLVYSTTYYVTWTDVHEQLGRAWDAAGNADSASHHYRHAVRAWSRADPEFDARRDSLESRLAHLARRE